MNQYEIKMVLNREKSDRENKCSLRYRRKRSQTYVMKQSKNEHTSLQLNSK